jgi:hypothetical protein
MRDFKTEAGRRYCRCGALTEATTTLCRKCRARARWYRRKAWRINPAPPHSAKFSGKR